MAGGTRAISAAALRRRVLEDLDEAVISLGFIDNDPVESVHESRKRIKRVRATLRLLRPIDKRLVDREDKILRHGAQLLGPIRDRHVAQHLAQKMGRWPGDMMPPPMAPSVRLLTSQASVILIGARVRAGDWADGWDGAAADDHTLLHELDRGYRVARQRWNRASDHLDRDDLHHCRKALKRSVNQLEIVSESFAAQNRTRDMAELGELLGNHHDLGLIPDHDRHDQTDLELKIVELGGSVFALSPKRHRAWVESVLDS